MESRLIYKTSEHIKSKVKWIKVTESEWIYCGSNGDVKFEIVSEHIKHHFLESNFYVALNRNESFVSNSETIFRDIRELVGMKDFFLWDFSFVKVIEFNHIGVFREGEFFIESNHLVPTAI